MEKFKPVLESKTTSQFEMSSSSASSPTKYNQYVIGRFTVMSQLGLADTQMLFCNALDGSQTDEVHLFHETTPIDIFGNKENPELKPVIDWARLRQIDLNQAQNYDMREMWNRSSMRTNRNAFFQHNMGVFAKIISAMSASDYINCMIYAKRFNLDGSARARTQNIGSSQVLDNINASITAAHDAIRPFIVAGINNTNKNNRFMGPISWDQFILASREGRQQFSQIVYKPLNERPPYVMTSVALLSGLPFDEVVVLGKTSLESLDKFLTSKNIQDGDFDFFSVTQMQYCLDKPKNDNYVVQWVAFYSNTLWAIASKHGVVSGVKPTSTNNWYPHTAAIRAQLRTLRQVNNANKGRGRLIGTTTANFDNFVSAGTSIIAKINQTKAANAAYRALLLSSSTTTAAAPTASTSTASTPSSSTSASATTVTAPLSAPSATPTSTPQPTAVATPQPPVTGTSAPAYAPPATKQQFAPTQVKNNPAITSSSTSTNPNPFAYQPSPALTYSFAPLANQANNAQLELLRKNLEMRNQYESAELETQQQEGIDEESKEAMAKLNAK